MNELWTEHGNNFRMNISGTEYEVSTHFDSSGRQSVLQQFRALFLNSNRHLTTDMIGCDRLYCARCRNGAQI